VVEDHLGLQPLLAFSRFAKIEQAPGVEEGVGVALEAARVPGKVDQQPVQDLPRVGAGGPSRRSRASAQAVAEITKVAKTFAICS
jgi:hypothetical protein